VPILIREALRRIAVALVAEAAQTRLVIAALFFGGRRVARQLVVASEFKAQLLLVVARIGASPDCRPGIGRQQLPRISFIGPRRRCLGARFGRYSFIRPGLSSRHLRAPNPPWRGVAITSSSDIASRRCQSVAPLGRGSPALTVIHVIPVLLTSISFPRRNDVTEVFAAHRYDREQDAPSAISMT